MAFIGIKRAEFVASGIRQYKFNGFYFRAGFEQKDLDIEVYGTTTTTYEFGSHIINSNNCKLKMFVEGYWWGHQDLYIVQKV